MLAQVEQYGARLIAGTIESLSREMDGTFSATVGADVIKARYVLMATGGLDVEPEIAHIREAVKEGLVRYCPICDAFEAAGRRIALISYGKCRVREALLLRAYTADLTVLTVGCEMDLAPAEAD